jgi:hypothetical protein
MDVESFSRGKVGSYLRYFEIVDIFRFWSGGVVSGDFQCVATKLRGFIYLRGWQITIEELGGH